MDVTLQLSAISKEEVVIGIIYLQRKSDTLICILLPEIYTLLTYLWKTDISLFFQLIASPYCWHNSTKSSNRFSVNLDGDR